MSGNAKLTALRARSAMLSRRALLHRAARGVIAVPALLGLKAPPAAALPATNTFIMAQLQYRGGHWDPRPLAVAPLMQEMRQRTSVETQNERRILTPRDPALFSHPFLYMTGEQAFEPFDTEELEILRRYLRFGGLMLIDDARGNKGQDFDASVRREIARLFPTRSLKILSPDHSVFRTYYLIRTLGGVRIVNPYLEGVHHRRPHPTALLPERPRRRLGARLPRQLGVHLPPRRRSPAPASLQARRQRCHVRPHRQLQTGPHPSPLHPPQARLRRCSPSA